jgi:hypothetical protein
MNYHNKRLFAFGCSYTEYSHLTCADLVGVNFGEYYNFGKSGCDNTFIANRLVEVHNKFKLDPKSDFVLVGTTGFSRFSYWYNCNWITVGDMLPYNGNNEQIKWLSENLYNHHFALYRSVLAIKTIKNLLTALKIPYILYPALDYVDYLVDRDYEEIDTYGFTEIAMAECEKIENLYTIPTSIDEFLADTKRNYIYYKDENTNDTHPSPIEHYEYMKKFMPQFDSIKSQQVIKQFANNNYDSRKQLKDKMDKFRVAFRKDIYVEEAYFLRDYPTGQGPYYKHRDIL